MLRNGGEMGNVLRSGRELWMLILLLQIGIGRNRQRLVGGRVISTSNHLKGNRWETLRRNTLRVGDKLRMRLLGRRLSRRNGRKGIERNLLDRRKGNRPLRSGRDMVVPIETWKVGKDRGTVGSLWLRGGRDLVGR